jgi:hypothetical protein
MKYYRLDPKRPRKLTPSEAQRLASSPIDYSDIRQLGKKFLQKQQQGCP